MLLVGSLRCKLDQEDEAGSCDIVYCITRDLAAQRRGGGGGGGGEDRFRNYTLSSS